MEFIELGALSLGDWVRLTGRERTPFGAAAADLTFRPKDRHVGIRDDGGRLVAVAGATIVTVEITEYGSFEVVGQGALIVHEEMRGRGLSGPLMGRLRALVSEMGPDRAMLFCTPELMSLYVSRGYAPVPGPVWVDQPGGRIAMPIPAMWRAVRPAEWPPGAVHLRGLPF